MVDHSLVPQLIQEVLALLNISLLRINGGVGTEANVATNFIGAELLHSLYDSKDVALVVIRSIVIWQSQVDMCFDLDTCQRELLNFTLWIQVSHLERRNLLV